MLGNLPKVVVLKGPAPTHLAFLALLIEYTESLSFTGVLSFLLKLPI